MHFSVWQKRILLLAVTVLGGIEADEIIDNPDDPEEIAVKIDKLSKAGNHTRIIVETDKESGSWTRRAEELLEIVRKFTDGEKF